ncbi:MAG: response regulator [Xanthobacteraceae bacterium]|nr:MAG: response regulator [Xanthobacteraceae bacterium]
MSLAKSITPILPYLRRFARAISGSQHSGDSYVASTLEALVVDPSIFPVNLSPRVGVYKLFTDMWSSVSINMAEDLPDDEEENISAGQRNLNRLTPMSRQAFLLSTVEGFSTEDVAAILGVGRGEVETLIKKAGREIATQVATTVLIVEDEPLIALDIEALVTELGHRIAGIARTHKEAVRLAFENPPGLVLADIQLADGSSGMEAVAEILKRFSMPVIFITAYPERLLTGERPEPAFLITKPFDSNMVRATISQALFFDRRASRSAA